MPDARPAFPPHAVAIVGLAGRFPGAGDLDAFWDNVRTGREALEDFSDADLAAAGVPAALRADPLYVRKGTHLEGAELFDAGFFGVSPREAQVLDPQHRVFLECAWEALEHAGYGGSAAQGVVGVYAGASMNTYLLGQVLRDPSVAEAAGAYQLMLGNDKDFLCTRASYKLDLRGPSMTVQTACSTSLVAVELACRALNRGECDMALAGGVSLNFPLRAGYLYQDGMILSPDGHCRPFDAEAAGTRPGAGAGIVVLKRLTDALADGDTIHAVIRGAAVNNDGADKAGYTAPSVDGQIEAIAMAQALADVDPRTITYVEAHGTATPLGDPIEIRALTEVFRASTDDVGFCRLGSLKANLGHLDAAAGVAGLIKATLALSHGEIPPLVNFRSPNPQLELETSPFAASAELTPWTTDGAPRRAGVSSFGIGGTNAHVVLEEAPASAPSEAAGPHLLLLSARTPTALDQATANLAAHLERHSEQSLADVAWTLHAGRKAFAHRRAVVVETREDAVRRLKEPLALTAAAHEGGERPVAFLFSGQGSQHPGMGAGLYQAEAVFKDAVDRCAAILEPHLGLDIREVMFGEAEDALGQTRLTQPALFTVEYALAKLWESWGVKPRAMLGHSIGEYVAAHLAGVLSLEDALALVAARGRLMQAMAPGAMAAVHLSAAALRLRLTDGVEIAAVNGPSLCTVAGPTPAVEAFLARLEAEGVDGRRLHTSHAFHSAMMEPALAEFTAVVERAPLNPPSIPYVSNLTGGWITPEQATSPAYYAQHLRGAVQFEAGMRTLAADGSLFFLEVGPGDALSTLARANLEGAQGKLVAASLSHPRQKRADGLSVREAAGRLWLAGAKLDPEGVHGLGRRRVPAPTYPFERSRYSVDGPPAAVGARSEGVEVEASGGEVRLYAPTWTRDASPAPQRPRLSGTWIVFGSDGPLSRALSEAIDAAGGEPLLLEPARAPGRRGDVFQVRPGSAEDIEAAIRTAARSAAFVSGAVYAWEPTPADAGTFGAMAGYEALVRLAAVLGDAGHKARIVVASEGGQSVFGEPVRRVDAALPMGAVLTLPAELPAVAVRSVDLDPTTAPAAAAILLVEEAVREDAEPFVAWRAGCRWLRRYEPFLPAEGSAPPVKPGGAYLITGGLGGLGLAFAGWLAQTASARLLLTARTPLPPREQWDERLAKAAPGDRSLSAIRAIRALEAQGAEVLAAAADAADVVAMRRAVDEARARWGAIDGVIHAAGVPGAVEPSFLETAEEMLSVVSPKRDGLSVLTELLGEAPLDFVVLMSSINSIARFPNAGPYAAANAVLDSFVESGAVPAAWRRVLAINWGPWREVGMAANLAVPEAKRAERDAFLKQAIEPAAGVRALAHLLASGRTRAVATSFDLLKAVYRTEPPASPATGAPERAAAAQPAPAMAFAAPTTDVEGRLVAIWKELLGAPQIGVDDDFFELGGHSLLATRVLARISSAFGIRLALRDIFEAPTVRRLAERISVALNQLQAEQDDQEEILI